MTLTEITSAISTTTTAAAAEEESDFDLSEEQQEIYDACMDGCVYIYIL